MKTITHDSSKIDGYLVFSSLGAKKELTMVKNQKNRYKKDATIEKRTILLYKGYSDGFSTSERCIMLNNISKILTGDMLKALCDMGHGDVLIISDANFPGDTVAQRLIRCPGVDVSAILKAIVDLFPLDIAYTEHPAAVMQLTPGDAAKGMKRPESWADFESILRPKYPGLTLGEIERFEFYERAKKAFVVIQSGEERQYGNLLLVKGCVL